MAKKQYFKTIYELITAGHQITDSVTKCLKKYGVTEPQYNVLRSLKEANGSPMPVQELQEKMVQKSSNVTRLVDKLIAKGFVDRKECPSNRRKMDITIKDEGLEFLLKLDREVHKMHKPVMNQMTESELITLEKLLIKIKSHLNE